MKRIILLTSIALASLFTHNATADGYWGLKGEDSNDADISMLSLGYHFN